VVSLIGVRLARALQQHFIEPDPIPGAFLGSHVLRVSGVASCGDSMLEFGEQP
jgi:hypothetical protein